MKEITYEELKALSKDSFVPVDIRDEGLRAYGTLPQAVAVDIDESPETVGAQLASIPKDRKLVFYCEVGRKTRDLDNEACFPGWDCYSLTGGYIGFERARCLTPEGSALRMLRIERSYNFG